MSHETVHPIDRLISLPIENWDTITEVVTAVVPEVLRFCFRLVGTGEVVETAQQISALCLLVMLVAVRIDVSGTLGCLDYNTLNGTRHGYQVQVRLVAAYVDEVKHKSTPGM